MDAFNKPGLFLIWVMPICLVLIPTLPVAFAIFICALVYCFERAEEYLKTQAEQKLYDTNIVLIQNQLDEIKKAHEGILKTSDETKKLLSQANLSRAMGSKSRLS